MQMNGQLRREGDWNCDDGWIDWIIAMKSHSQASAANGTVTVHASPAAWQLGAEGGEGTCSLDNMRISWVLAMMVCV